MRIQRFDRSRAGGGHGGTILASAFLPEGVEAPFGSAYGYLEAGGAMEAHSHPTHEIYIILQGEGIMSIEGEEARVTPGDVIDIPPGARHTIRCERGALLWAALWWEPRA